MLGQERRAAEARHFTPTGPQARPAAGRAGAAGDGWGIGHSSNTGQEEEVSQAEPAWRGLDGAWGRSHGPPWGGDGDEEGAGVREALGAQERGAGLRSRGVTLGAAPCTEAGPHAPGGACRDGLASFSPWRTQCLSGLSPAASAPPRSASPPSATRWTSPSASLPPPPPPLSLASWGCPQRWSPGLWCCAPEL